MHALVSTQMPPAVAAAAAATPSTAPPPLDEDAIIRHRLLTGVAGVRGEPPLKKLAKA